MFMHQNTSKSTPDLGPSLAQFLREERRQFPDISEALQRILHAFASAGKIVNEVVRKLDLTGMIGSQGVYNLSGDEQQNLDMLSHHYFVDALAATEEVCAVISEEAAGIIEFTNSCGSYIIALDPLDGSPNIDVNAAIGTIFSVYQRRSSRSMPVQQEDVLQEGSRQLAAGYILYGTSTMLVYTACHGVHGFTYEPSMGQFFLAYQAMQMPKSGQSYAINDGYFDTFPSYVQHYVQQCRLSSYTARYMGALVADFHRHLIKGGIYLYPPTRKNPEGKLRLMLECNALAFIAEQAGGKASNGQQSILAIQPHAIHQRVPLYVGSKNMVQSLLGEVV
jgi:fructose-1,6-bisphosphatase I